MKKILILLILIIPFLVTAQTCTGIDNPNTLGIDDTDCTTFIDYYHGQEYTWNGSSWDLSEAVLCDDILYVSNNVVISGTIDGYDISVMGVKLAGIPSNATAPQALSSVISVGDAGGAKVENIGAATANTDAVQFVQMKPQSGTGSPSGSVTPRWIGDFYVDTTGASEVMWMSYGTGNTDWKQISN